MNIELTCDPITNLYYREHSFDLSVINEQKGYRKIFDNIINVLDIGANIGAFANIAYRYGAKKVYSFEPEAVNFIILAKNRLDLNLIFNLAVVENGNEEKMIMYVNTKSNKGMHSLIKRRGRQRIMVDTIQINDVFNICEFDTVKIDIEGYEYRIFETFDLPESVRNLAIEYHFDRNVFEHQLAIKLHKKFIEQGFISLNHGNLAKMSWSTMRMYRRSILK